MKHVTRITDVVGIIYLASFVLNTGLLWFFMRASVVCNFVDRGTIYVNCGLGAAKNFLSLYFFYFSPLVVQVMRGNTYRVIYNPEPLSAAEFWPVFGFFIGSWLVLFCCIVTLQKIIRGLIHRKERPEAGKRAKLMLLAILLPAFISFGARLYIKPPKFVSRTVTVDIWHGEFNVPRDKLDDWSLVTPDRLPFKPDDYASVLTRKWKWVPFLEFDFPDNVPMMTLPGASAIHVNPHYQVLDAEGLQKERDRIAQLRLRKITTDTGEPAYGPVKEVRQEWEIHRAKAGIDDFFADIYLWRGPEGIIQRILECTPDNYCAAVTPFKWVNYPCAPGQDCGTCRKICTDRSQGARDYDVVYNFDKKYLDRYSEIRSKIMAYVGRFYNKKN